MATAPASPFSPRSRPAVTWGVFLGSLFGARPAISQRVDWLKPSTIHLTVDGSQFDTINLVVITSKAGIRVQDLNVPLGYNRIVEVRQLDDAGQWSKVIAWGQLATQGQRLARNDESLTAVARLDWFLFGGRLKHFRVWDDIAAVFLNVEQDIVFNPMIDGQPEGNRSDQFATESTGENVRVFVSPESLRTPSASVLQDQTRDLWTLKTAIVALCWELNPDQEYITNPTFADLDAVITDASERLMKDIRVPLGSSLPHALDLVCEPLGYHWFTETVVDELAVDVNGNQTFPVSGTYLRFFKNGAGVTTDLKCQRVGEAITSDATNIADYTATLEIATPNVVYGRGSLKQREGTFTLVPGWPSSLDTTPPQTINSQLFFNTEDKDLRNVGRFWVLNEAGDWGDPALRLGITDHTDLSDLFDEDVVRLVRRRFLPMLTKTKSESDRSLRGSGGIVVEWNDANGDWQPYNGGWSVAEHQCGIELQGEIPEEFWTEFLSKAGDVGEVSLLNPHVRVTACIESDTRLSYTAIRRDEAPNGRDIPLHLDLDNRFHDRLVKLSGAFAVLWSGNHFDVSAVESVNSPWSFTVDADLSNRLTAGDTFIVRDSTGNDGRYKVTSTVSGVGPQTTIYVAEQPPDATADGKIGIDTEEAADLPAMTRFCVEARNVHDGAKVAVSASLKGHDWSEYKRGNIVKAVQPRGLDLNNYNNTVANTRHPQIIGINYAFGDDSQRMELVLEVPDAERPELEKYR